MTPLAGCTVLDLGIITAGAGASAVLADLGADVIKVESPIYRDPFRQWSAETAIEADAPLPPFFRATNRNKSGISLDLKSAGGREAFLRLVAHADVVVENFRRGVLARLGLDFDVLKARNPHIILASISSQGETGPDAHYVSFGSTLEGAAGLAAITGYAGEEPRVSGVDVNYPDQITTVFAAGMIVTAWHARKRGDGAVHLDISQRELQSFLIGEAFLTSGTPGATLRQGNQQAPYVLQDCFQCRDGRYVALSVEAANVQALREFLASHAERIDNKGLCDTLSLCADEATAVDFAAALQRSGLAAAVVLSGEEVMATRGQGWSMALVEMPDGAFVKGFPFQFDDAPMRIARDAPKLGADTANVLRCLCGLSETDAAALLAT